MSSQEPEILDVGNGVLVKWPDHDARILLEYMKRQSNGLVAECTVDRGPANLCESIRLNLNTEGTTHAVGKKLAALNKEIPWARMLETTCIYALRHVRTGEPVIRLDGDADSKPRPFRLNPLVIDRLPNILYGVGDIGKSFLSMLCCLLVESGGCVAGLGAMPGRALFLDWESDGDDLMDRAARIRRGHPELGKATPLYMRCLAPLKEELPRIRKIVAAENISFCVIDSVGPAAGSELEKADTAFDLFRCLRKLGIAALLVGHPPRYADPDKDTDIFGSSFFKYGIRNQWEVRGESGDKSITLGLFHRKHNLTGAHPAFGLRLDFDGVTRAVRFDIADLTETETLAAKLPLPARIRNLLDDGVPRTASEIATELGITKVKSLRDTLHRDHKKKWTKLLEKQGKEDLWTCLSR